MDDRELRSVLWGTSSSRTMRYMRLLEEEDLDESVREILLLLSDCFPAGNKRDIRGASLRQLGYICVLAGFDESLTHEFARINNLAGGLDSGQAHTIITRLKGKKSDHRYVR